MSGTAGMAEDHEVPEIDEPEVRAGIDGPGEAELADSSDEGMPAGVDGNAAAEQTEAAEMDGAAPVERTEPADADEAAVVERAEAAEVDGAAPVERTEPADVDGRFLRRSVTVEVPATTANLGAGYDALAMALDLVNRVTVELLSEPGLDIEIGGQGADTLARDRHNRFVVALETGIRWALGDLPEGLGWRIRMENSIPLARGLGSSAAATVAGLVAAEALTGHLDEQRVLALACEIEGHPDNAAAALLGGFVVATMVDGRPEAVRFEVPRALRAVLFIPTRSLETSAMRATLPHGVPHRDAVFNVGRAALTVAGIASGRYEVLRAGTEDRLHEPYRAEAYPELPHLVRAARDAGALGACLSGAGSSVVAFGDSMSVLADIQQAFAGAAADQEIGGAIEILAPRNAGAIVIEAR